VHNVAFSPDGATLVSEVVGRHRAAVGGGNGLTTDRRGEEYSGQGELNGRVRQDRRDTETRSARREIPRDPPDSWLPRSWREHNRQGELNGRDRQMSVEFQRPLYWGTEAIPRIPLFRPSALRWLR
jgi:hypothetical protein